MVISDAGLYNTFRDLVPPEVSKKSYYNQLCQDFVPGPGCISVFVGLDASNEELGLTRQNYWAFQNSDQGLDFEKYFEVSQEESMDVETPLIFISFPSTKDPNWKNHPGRENKATMAIITFAKWDWYKQWDQTQLKKRGEEYEELKTVFGQKMIDRCCQLFPKIKDHIDYVDVGSPLTHKHYIAQPHGEIYGLDHTKLRLDALHTAMLRPKTDIPGLYMTGQDIFLCGLAGASIGGLIAAGQVLDRNLPKDLLKLQKSIIQKHKKKSA